MNEDQTLIDVRLAAAQEVRVRKFHALSLMLAGALFIVLVLADFLGLLFPAVILGIFVLMFFYVKNQKEINRLVEKYE